MEKEIVGQMQRGNERGYGDPMLVSPYTADCDGEDRHPELKRRAQRSAVNDIFLSREKIVGLDGVAGGGRNNDNWLWSMKVLRRRGTRSKDSHRLPAPLISSAKPVSRLQHFSVTLPKANSRTPERSDCMYSMSRHWPLRARCTSL